jgi:hypothetical protein
MNARNDYCVAGKSARLVQLFIAKRTFGSNSCLAPTVREVVNVSVLGGAMKKIRFVVQAGGRIKLFVSELET